MKAPDKIYVREYQDGDYTTWWDEKPHEEESIGMKAVCYIRKDALIEWLNDNIKPLNVLFGEIFVSRVKDKLKLL